MERRALILVEGTISTGLRFIQAARRLGLHPITLSADPGRYDYIAAESVEAIRVDTDNVDALIRECSRLRESYDIVGITSALEDVYATVGRLCRHFNLPGPNSASIERCCDKFTQRQLLAEAGVSIPAYRLAATLAEVDVAAADIGLPVILKPAVGSGSHGVRLCRNFDELAEHTTYLFSGKHVWQSSPRVLIEEFADGPFYCAHLMGNELIAVGSGEFGPPPYFVFREVSYPAPLTDDDRERIADVSLRCLRALGLGWGPTNIEFRWTGHGPVVIEVNPRLVCGADPELVRLACGVDMIAEHIKLVIGNEWDLGTRHSHAAAAGYLLPANDGTLDWVDDHSRWAAISGVAEVMIYVKPKTLIVRKGDYRDRIGHVIAASPSLAQTKQILRRAVDLIDLSITPFPPVGEQERCAANYLPADGIEASNGRTDPDDTA
ncbi:acetyl-CoA carboxylase biotin carboxylase subunit family protein [Mesorhizobium sp.]|uniref:ATP-grasp domain-containing protein n=1 Tax=Mesorhizobium sp. TaxID=1871066 RepID=UPI000FE53AF2|nr:acetyl-CoA carboxylase biotin carboxylase subunit family protein [Mesorhizobium sp.]RWQ15466.1 MAG: ATP-grasp domain-containing protein [Mesorhizobium sp.]